MGDSFIGGKISMNKIYSNKALAIGLIILFIGAAVLPAIGGIKTQSKNINIEREKTDFIVKEKEDFVTFKNLDSLNLVSHFATQTEINQMKAVEGVYDPSKQYNINNQGTGLLPPTEEQYDSMVGNMHVVDSHTPLGTIRGSIDLSSEPYFPQVRDQTINSNSCVAWSTPYYPDWRVIINELGMEFFVSQDGTLQY